MLRTLIIMAFVALNLNAVFAANVFTEEKVRNDATNYLSAHPELNGKVHPAYAISHAYLNNVGEVFGKSANETLTEQAKRTAWKILTEGYGWKGFDKRKTANPLEAKFAFDSLNAIFKNEGYKSLSVPSSTPNTKVADHLNLINALLGIAQKAGSQGYRNDTEIPDDALPTLQTWAAITNRGPGFPDSSALQMYQQIFKAAAPHVHNMSIGKSDAGSASAFPPSSTRRPSLGGDGRPDDGTGDPTGVSQSGVVDSASSVAKLLEAPLSISKTLALYKAQWAKERSPEMRLQTLEAIAVDFKNRHPSDKKFQQKIDDGLVVAKKAFDPDSYSASGSGREKNRTKLQFIVSLNNIFLEASYTTHHKEDLEEFFNIARNAIRAFSVNPLGDARQRIAQIKDLQGMRERGESIAGSIYHPDPINRTKHLGYLFEKLHPLDATYWDRIEKVTALTERAIHREMYDGSREIKPSPELQAKMDSALKQGQLISRDDPSLMEYQDRKLRAHIRFEMARVRELEALIANSGIDSPQAKKDFIEFATLARDAVVKNERYTLPKEAKIRAEIMAEQEGQEAGAAKRADTKRRAEQAEAVVRKMQQAFRKKQAQRRAAEQAEAARLAAKQADETAKAAAKISPEAARILGEITKIERNRGIVGFSQIQALAPLYKQLVFALRYEGINLLFFNG